MDDYTDDLIEDLVTDQNLPLPPQSSEKSWLRIVASLLTFIATLSFWVCAGIIAYIVFAGTVGVGDLFGYEWDVLGLLSLTGFLAYLIVFAAVVIVAAFAAGCTISNLKYRRMVKASNKYDPALFAVSDGVLGSIIYLYGTEVFFAVSWGFLMIWTGINNPVGYAGIVCIALQAVACIVATMEYVLCRYKFNGLSQEKRSELRSYSYALKASVRKTKKKKRIGKLY